MYKNCIIFCYNCTLPIPICWFVPRRRRREVGNGGEHRLKASLNPAAPGGGGLPDPAISILA